MHGRLRLPVRHIHKRVRLHSVVAQATDRAARCTGEAQRSTCTPLIPHPTICTTPGSRALTRGSFSRRSSCFEVSNPRTEFEVHCTAKAVFRRLSSPHGHS